MLALVGSEEAKTMEQEFDSKLRIQNSAPNSSTQRSKSFAFRAPQENFSIQDFELGKIYGVGSYSKVPFFCHSFFLIVLMFCFWLFLI